MRLKRIAAAAALFFFNSFPALAGPGPAANPAPEDKSFEEMFGEGPQEEDVYRNDRLLLTATGSLKPVHLAPSVATVITAEDIEKMGATTLDEALEAVPGLHVETSGAGWFSSIWSIRGIHTSGNPQVLLLINGVPFTSNVQGSRPFDFQMPVAMISRIEVVRGPGSALHGADAFSGTVNVITKDNFEIDGTQSGLRYGSFDSLDAWVQHGGQYKGWDVAFGVEARKTEGDDGRIIDTDYLHAQGAANVALSYAPGHLDTRLELLDTNLNLRKGDWELHLYGTRQELRAGGLGAFQALTYGSHMDTDALLTDFTYRNDHLFDNWELTGRVYYSYMRLDSFFQYFPVGFVRNWLGEPIHKMQDGGFEASGVYTGFASHQVRLGTGFKNYEYEPDQYRNFDPMTGASLGALRHITDPAVLFMPAANRQLKYGLVQDEWQFVRDWELTLGGRYDEYSDFGSTVNPRAALVWETRYDLTTKLMYGKAFRAPSFGEQYTKYNPASKGSQSLVPEEIENYELAFNYQPSPDLSLTLSLFTYEAKELIELVGPLPRLYTNYGEQEGKGFELEMDWQFLSDFRLRSNFAYQRSENTTIDAVVPDAPGMQFYLNPQWAFQTDWSLDGQLYWIADRQRAQADPRDDIDDYHLVNLVLRKKNIAKYWEAAVSIRNLFDEDARIPSPYAPPSTKPVPPPAGWGAFVTNDYPMEGRSVYGEVRFHY